MQKELSAFSQVLDPSKVQRPLTAIVGGAKISDKILVIENLIDQSDRVMCIGGMAYTFMKARAYLRGNTMITTCLACPGALVVAACCRSFHQWRHIAAAMRSLGMARHQ